LQLESQKGDKSKRLTGGIYDVYLSLANAMSSDKASPRGDLERILTQRVWADAEFAAAVENNPAAALESIRVTVPPGSKIKVVVQRRDTLYLTIPPAQQPGSVPDKAPVNQMDLWSSAGLFIWLAPLAFKFKLLQMRALARTQEISP
jgi:hypothetical protein